MKDHDAFFLLRNLYKIENYEFFLQQCGKLIVEKVNTYLKSLEVEKYL